MRIIKEYRWYIIFFFLLIGFVLLTDFNGLYGQDSYEYLRYTKSLISFIKTGANPGDYFWPLLYPIAGAILSFIFSPVFALQLISIAALIITAIYLEKIIVLVFNTDKQKVRAYTFLFFLLSPYMLRASMVVMSEGLCILCVTAAWYYYMKYRAELKPQYFIAFVFFSASAIETRYAAFIIVFIATLMVLFTFLRNFKPLSFLLAIVIVTVVFLPHILIRTHAPLAFIHHAWLESWSIGNFFRNHFDTQDGYAVYPFYNIIYCFFNLVHPAFLFVGILFIIARIKSIIPFFKVPVYSAISATVVLYALFLSGIPFQNMRFLLLSFPLVLILLFPGFFAIQKYVESNKTWLYMAAVAVVIIQLGLFYRVFVPFYNDNKIEKQIASEMLKYNKTTLYTFSIDGALKAYGYSGRIINMWSVKVDTLKTGNSSAMVLFNEKQFAEEWKGKNPMLNWGYLKTKYPLVKVESFPDDWELYKIQ